MNAPFEIGDLVNILPLPRQKNPTDEVKELVLLFNNSFGRITDWYTNQKRSRTEWIVQSIAKSSKRLRLRRNYLKLLIPTIQIHDTSEMNLTTRASYLQDIEHGVDAVSFFFDVEQIGYQLMANGVKFPPLITENYVPIFYFEWVERTTKTQYFAMDLATKVGGALTLMPIKMIKKIFVAVNSRLKVKHFRKVLDKIEKAHIQEQGWALKNNALRIRRRYNAGFTCVNKLLSALVTLDKESKDLLLGIIWHQIEIHFAEWRKSMLDKYRTQNAEVLMCIDVVLNYAQNVVGHGRTLHVFLTSEMDADIIKYNINGYAQALIENGELKAMPVIIHRNGRPVKKVKWGSILTFRNGWMLYLALGLFWIYNNSAGVDYYIQRHAAVVFILLSLLGYLLFAPSFAK